MASIPQADDVAADNGCALGRCRHPLIKAPARLAVLLAFFGLLLVLAPAALADSPGYQPDTTPLPSDITGQGDASSASATPGASAGTIVRAVAGLAIVLGVVYGLYWLLRSTARGRRAGGDGRVQVVATVPLAANRSLHLVQAGDEYLLVGAGESGVTPIRAYSAAEAVSLGIAEIAVPDTIEVPEVPAALPAPRGLLEMVRAWTVRT
jgi:flagellar protein FliO/FliZ